MQQRCMNSKFTRSRCLSSQFSSVNTLRSLIGKRHFVTFILFLFLVAAATTAAMSALWLNKTKFFLDRKLGNETMIIITDTERNPPKKAEVPVNCSNFFSKNRTRTGGYCPRNNEKTVQTENDQTEPNRTCPEYFKWIYEDLKPWRTTGITREMVERAKTTAHFRLVIINGRVFIEKYKKSIQTRDAFTVWGILQLLRKYPGKLLDVELMFDCDDRPVIRSNEYKRSNRTVEGPPALFRYCGDRWTVDIVFPDWSFWGWAEINIEPWEKMLGGIKEGNKEKKWMEREPYAYWKGNPFVAPTRRDLLICNFSLQHDWNARLFIQDWISEGQQGFKNSNIANQCMHRYKIYIEGYAWSVSGKYILACDSVTLMVKPYYHDFFSRSLQPLQHYWPIRDKDKCKSIKFAVDWLNIHNQKAQEIGKQASRLMQEDLKMENVYDYMFHLLNEYSKLLRFKPQVPTDGVEFCSESMVCPSDDNGTHNKRFMMGSLVNGPSTTGPCSLPPPFEPKGLELFYRKKLNVIRQVEKWENGYWKEGQ